MRDLELTKTIRGSQILKFIHYIHGLNFVAEEQPIFNDQYNYCLDLMFDPEHKDKNNLNHDWDFYNAAKSNLIKGKGLNILETSSYHDIVSSIQLVHEQSGVLSFISNHVLGIIVKNLKKLHYLKKVSQANKKYNMLLLASSTFFKTKKKINQLEINKNRYEELVEIERTFKEDYFTGKNIIAIAEELAIYIEVLLNHTKFMYHTYSSNYKALERFKLLIYTEILLDFLSAFQISTNQQKKYFSDDVFYWLNQMKIDYTHLDFHTEMQIIEKQNKYNRLSEAKSMSELWVNKIKKHAPLPEVIHYVIFKGGS